MKSVHVFRTISNRFRPAGSARARRWMIVAVSVAVAAIIGSTLLVLPGGHTGPLSFLHRHQVDSDIDYWTCSMHPQIHADGPGQCPICHMDLVPVKKKKKTAGTSQDMESPRSAEGSQTFPGDGSAKPTTAGPSSDEHVHGNSSGSDNQGPVEIPIERQQLIGLRIAVAEEKALHSRIQTTGRVAFDPELAIAIREYLTISGSDASLRQYAVTRLKMLGMGEEEIRTLPSRHREYESLYLQSGDTTWVYAALYQNDLPLVKAGMKAKIRLPSGGGGQEWEGTVRSVSPTVDAKTRNLQARIEIKHAKDLKPDMYVNVSILSNAGTGLVVPRDAVIDTGNEQLVYVIKDGTRFFPRKVRAGIEVDEGTVILEGLHTGETVVASATFLIDSESRLHGGTP